MIKLIPIEKNFINSIIEEIINYEINNFPSLSVIVPSKRMFLILQNKLNKKIEKNYFPPKILSFEIFLNEIFLLNLPQFTEIKKIEESYLLFDICKELFQDNLYAGGKINSFIDFFPWSIKILNAIEDFLTEGGSFDNFDLKNYKAFTDLGEYHKDYFFFLKNFPTIVEKFNNTLFKYKKYNRGFIYYQIHNLITSDKLKLFNNINSYIFAGFNSLNRAEEILFKKIYYKFKITIMLWTDQKSLDNRFSPFYLQNNLLNSFNYKKDTQQSSNSIWTNISKKVKFIPSVNREFEIYTVYYILKDLIKKNKITDFSKIGVVIPDPQSLIPFIHGVISRLTSKDIKIPFNITLLYPFLRTPIFQLIESIIKFNENIKNKLYLSNDFLEILKHPYINFIIDDNNEADFTLIYIIEEIIIKNNLNYINSEIIEKHIIDSSINNEIKKKTIKIIRILNSLLFNTYFKSFIELCLYLKSLIHKISENVNNDLILKNILLTSINSFEELINFSKPIESSLLPFDLTSSFKLIKFHFKNIDVNFSGSPTTGIQVMGMLEFRGLNFDHILILDCVEGIIPKRTKNDPILPLDIRNIFKIRNYSDWEKLYQYNFFSLIASSKNIFIFYPKFLNNVEQTRSRFIEKMIYQIEKKDKNIIEKNNIKYFKNLNFNLSLKNETNIEIEKDDYTRKYLTNFSFSSTSLYQYIKCPLSFYYKYILNLKKKDDLDSKLNILNMGKIVHRVLYKVYSKYDSYKTDEDLIKSFETNLDVFLKANGFINISGIMKIKIEILKRKIRAFLTIDFQRINENSIQILGLEKNININYFINSIDSSINLIGKIDRIEKENNITKIIDYKIGEKITIPNIKNPIILEKLFLKNHEEYINLLYDFSESYKHFQLLLYILMYSKFQNSNDNFQNFNGVFFQLKEEKKKIYNTVFKNPTDINSIMYNFKINLNYIIEDVFKRDSFLANPNRSYCEYCEYKFTCKK